MARNPAAAETLRDATLDEPNVSGERRIAAETRPVSPAKPSPGRYRKVAAERVVDGRYAIGRLIGEGGMGKVYHCRHVRLRSRLAIKILRRQFTFDSELAERFLNEAAAASAIDSVHVVQMRDCGILGDGRPYLVMDFLEGESLWDRLEREPLPRRSDALEIFRQLCSGLMAAHAAGIIHRDLKPENIHLCKDEDGRLVVKLLDFGVARILDTAGSVTAKGAVFGTPQYMSPEQSRGTAVDQRSDIYSAGVLLYEMLTGCLPFDGETAVEILSKHRYQPATPPRQLPGGHERPREELDRLVMRCLAKDSRDRFQSVSELLAELSLAERGAKIVRKALTSPHIRGARFNGVGRPLRAPHQ